MSTQLRPKSQCPVGLAAVTVRESTWPEHSQSEPSPGIFLLEVGGEESWIWGKRLGRMRLWAADDHAPFLCGPPVVGKHVTEKGRESVKERPGIVKSGFSFTSALKSQNQPTNILSCLLQQRVQVTLN